MSKGAERSQAAHPARMSTVEAAPRGGVARWAAGLTLLWSTVMLVGAVRGAVDAVQSVTSPDWEWQFRWSGLPELLPAAAALFMMGVGFYGGVQLLRRKKIGQWLVIAFSAAFLVLTIWICVTVEFAVLLPVYALISLLLAISRSTSRWIAHGQNTLH